MPFLKYLVKPDRKLNPSLPLQRQALYPLGHLGGYENHFVRDVTKVDNFVKTKAKVDYVKKLAIKLTSLQKFNEKQIKVQIPEI